MKVYAVLYDSASFSEDLYQRGLLLVDPQSTAKIKRFFKRDDACRTLIGRLMVRMLLKEKGIVHSSMTFGATQAGKLYITSPPIDPPLAFNITHDNGLVAMAFGQGDHYPPAYSIGVDVMKIRVPGRETFRAFVDTVGDQLTPLEYRLLFDGVTQEEGLRRFFWMWTMKEAYTKALGIGLGFDFRRVEYNVPEDRLTVDGQIPKGWRFHKFEITERDDHYLGVAAQYVGGEETLFISCPSDEWIVQYDASSFVEMAINSLQAE